MKHYSRWLATVAAALALAACGAPVAPDEAPRPWLEYAGEPVQSVRYARLVDWRPLGRDTVMIRFEGRRFYTVRVRQPCIAHTREADRLGIDTAGDRLLRENDSILLDDHSCLAGEIRPLDWGAYTAAKAER